VGSPLEITPETQAMLEAAGGGMAPEGAPPAFSDVPEIGGAPAPEEAAAPAQAPQEGQDYAGATPERATECVLQAVIAGCEAAAMIAEPGQGEDFWRFATGVNQLVQALDNMHSPAGGITSPEEPHPMELEERHARSQVQSAQAAKTLMEAMQAPAELALRQQQVEQRSQGRPPASAR
jgi:hypothetical protein